MTAEVVIMNKGGVALAADSAVTLIGANGNGGKIFNSANKLYMLAPNYPIGILTYNNTDLMNLPWEIIIQLYREYLKTTGKRFKKFAEMPTDFIQFIQSRAEDLFPEPLQRVYVEHRLDVFMRDNILENFTQRLKQEILDTSSKVPEIKLKEFMQVACIEACENWSEWEDLPNIDTFLEKFTISYRNLFESKYQQYLGNFPLSAENKEQLWHVCTQWFTKKGWFLDQFSGLAFAGYGDEDMYPSFSSYHFESYVCEYLKHGLENNFAIGSNGWAGILPLAQIDMVQTVIGGVHPNYMNILRNKLIETKAMSEEKIDKLLADSVFQMTSNYTSSIINIVANLPKDELAAMAETLVSITSFMRKVSNVLETVGGPVDVAVISKKDGFIWIKRKHYFDPEYNYHFFENRRLDENRSPIIKKLSDDIAKIQEQLREKDNHDANNNHE